MQQNRDQMNQEMQEANKDMQENVKNYLNPHERFAARMKASLKKTSGAEAEPGFDD